MSLKPTSKRIAVLIYILLFAVAGIYSIKFLPDTSIENFDTSATSDDELIIDDENNYRHLASPKFHKQKLKGYDPKKTFKSPEGLQFRVDFWKEVYGTYRTDQIIIHDNKWLVIYSHVDISDLNKKNISRRELQRLKNRRVNKVKSEYSRLLQNIHKNRRRPGKLSRKGQILFQKFARIKDPNKFLRASNTKRIRAQVGQKDRFKQGIYYAGQYIKEMEEIFASYDLPMELTRLPFVESSFNLNARSKVGASGIWQFIRSTGRLYLRINQSVDERNDPILATHAAAKLLRQNYKSLKSWPLALTAYNHGRHGMLKAVRQSGTKDIAWLADNYKSRTFGFASRNFYAEFLAALEVQTNYPKYFGKTKVADPIKVDHVKMGRAISARNLVKYCRIKQDTLKKLNPALSRRVWRGQRHIPRGYRLNIPKGTKKRFLARLKSVPTSKPSTARARSYYTVRKGDTLGRIARKHKTSVSKLKRANKITGTKIRAGQILVIP